MINKIKKINDVKKLNTNEKIYLARDIREKLVDVTSKNGGHLASNLGVVELTIALESVLDMKRDKIVWDVGHQSYVHKILSGRDISNIRTYKGISGFPKLKESPSDSFDTGHSSTSVSAALGIAKARDLNNDNYNVVAVIGDGALTGGMALEALNHVGSSKTKILIVLNDNEMSISKNIGGINRLLTRLRLKKTYNFTNNFGRRVVNKIPYFGKYIVKGISKIKNSIKQLFITGMYFEEIGLRYIGPVDGHNIESLEKVFSQAILLDGPTIIHVKTVKGCGYQPAVENPSKFHGISKFDKGTGEVLTKKNVDYSAVFGNKLVTMARRNKKIVAITAAMKDGTGLNVFAEKFPERFFDVGIAEQHALTFAAGLATQGYIPFVPIYSSFYQRAYDQVIHDICIQNLHVVMCVDRAGIVGADGETHQGLFDMSFFRLIPNITILAPKDYKEFEMMLEFSLKHTGPIVIRYPRGAETVMFENVDKKITYAKAEVLSTGTDVTILTIGKTVAKGREVTDKLLQAGISCEHINVRFLKPIDRKTIVRSISKTGLVVTIEDGTIIGGLSTAIKELIAEEGIQTKIECFAYNDVFVEHGSVDELEKAYKLDSKSIVSKIKRDIKKRR